MAYTCKIVYSDAYKGGTVAGTVDLNDATNFILMNYTPGAAPIDASSITDSIRVQAFGTSQNIMQAYLDNLEKAFIYARDYQRTKNGPRVTLRYMPDGLSAYGNIESEIMSGYIEFEDPYMFNWSNNKHLFGEIVVERANYWQEDVSNGLVQICNYYPVWGSVGTNFGSVTNNGGNIPTPLGFSVSLAGTSTGIRYFYMFASDYKPGNFLTTYGTAPISIPQSGISTGIMVINDHKSGKFSEFAVELGFNGTIYATPNVVQNGATIYYNRFTLINTGTALRKFFDLGLIQTPPISPTSGTIQYSISLDLKNSVAGTLDAYEYHSWIIPVDSYVKGEILGNYLGTPQVLCIMPQMPNGNYIYSGVSGVPVGWVSTQGTIMIRPGVTTYIYPLFVHSGGEIYSGTSAWSINAEMNNRRLKI